MAVQSVQPFRTCLDSLLPATHAIAAVTHSFMQSFENFRVRRESSPGQKAHEVHLREEHQRPKIAFTEAGHSDD